MRKNCCCWDEAEAKEEKNPAKKKKEGETNDGLSSHSPKSQFVPFVLFSRAILIKTGEKNRFRAKRVGGGKR